LHLLILGSSVRAAAYSARRAGLVPVAADLFADRDLKQIAHAQRVDSHIYPAALVHAAARVPDSPWIYTGALENHPDLVAQIARQRPLWGNHAPVLRAVRDPFAVAETLRAAGLCAPAVKRTATGLPHDDSWLVKPLASAGGTGIVPLGRGHDGADPSLCYFQERIVGPSLGAVFIASRNSAGGDGTIATTLAGVTRQWIGRRDSPFAYAGSVGPWPLTPRLGARIEQVGRTLAAAFGLVGLFGVDLIVRDGEPWPVEVNPRYTASVEVLELALGRSLLAEHARACNPETNEPTTAVARVPRPRVIGKLVVFATARCGFPDSLEPAAAGTAGEPFSVPDLADIPDPGTVFEPGQPVLTLLAAAPTVAACRLELKRRRAGWLARLRQSSSIARGSHGSA
jgi:predicted ATP-grasp superfamily ATP-dependent carboligase